MANFFVAIKDDVCFLEPRHFFVIPRWVAVEKVGSSSVKLKIWGEGRWCRVQVVEISLLTQFCWTRLSYRWNQNMIFQGILWSTYEGWDVAAFPRCQVPRGLVFFFFKGEHNLRKVQVVTAIGREFWWIFMNLPQIDVFTIPPFWSVHQQYNQSQRQSPVV